MRHRQPPREESSRLRRHSHGRRQHDRSQPRPFILNYRDVGASMQACAKKPPARVLRPGLLLRSAALSRVEAASEIGNPKTIINLRMSQDRNAFGARMHDVPLPNTDDVYTVSSPRVQEWLKQIFELIVSPTCQFPVLLHCKSGKDRTGVAVAAILVALGYTDEDIIRDFSITPRSVPEKLRKSLSLLRNPDILKAVLPESKRLSVLLTTTSVATQGKPESNPFENGVPIDIPTRVPVTYLDQKSSRALDVDLMEKHGFKLEQLMELAGLSIACAMTEKYGDLQKFGNVLIVCGPGNNGGDGLVAARHLWQFGFRPRVIYPQVPPKKDFFVGLLKQVEELGIEVSKTLPELGRYPLIVDAMFGFSFSGTPRSPYDQFILTINKCDSKIVSVDVPSGWDVERGNVTGLGIAKPDMLVSLTAPKLSARKFSGRFHMLGGRFVPPAITTKYNLSLPIYPSSSQCVEIPHISEATGVCTPVTQERRQMKSELGSAVSKILQSSTL